MQSAHALGITTFFMSIKTTYWEKSFVYRKYFIVSPLSIVSHLESEPLRFSTDAIDPLDILGYLVYSMKMKIPISYRNPHQFFWQIKTNRISEYFKSKFDRDERKNLDKKAWRNTWKFNKIYIKSAFAWIQRLKFTRKTPPWYAWIKDQRRAIEENSEW